MASRIYTVFMLVGLVSVPQVIGGIGFFWHVADLHYDPTVFTDTQQKPYGDYVNDSPWSLVNSSLHAMKQIEPNADFILWTGDTGPHRKNSVENTISIIHDVTNLFIDVFPNTVVYAAFGNHDYSPPDQFPPHENKIYYAAANMWQRWYRDSTAKKTLLKGGYYAISIREGLVIVVLNTNLYYNNNQVTADMSDPAGQFQWFDQVLEQAAENGNKAYVIAHIPPGMSEEGHSILRRQFNQRLNDLIIKHKNTIAAMFYGHQHTDTFKLWYAQGEPVAFALIAPSVTPWSSHIPPVYLKQPVHNPTIRLLQYDRQSFQVKDYWHHYLELSEANKKGKAHWKKGYKFSEAYGTEDVSSISLAHVVSNFEKRTDVFMKYLRYNINSAKGKTIKTSCDAKCKRRYICSIKEVDAERFKKCI